MKKRTVSLLLLCIVALSILSICGGASLSFQATQAVHASTLFQAEATEKALDETRLPALRLIPMGDPVDDPTPHIRH